MRVRVGPGEQSSVAPAYGVNSGTMTTIDMEHQHESLRARKSTVHSAEEPQLRQIEAILSGTSQRTLGGTALSPTDAPEMMAD